MGEQARIHAENMFSVEKMVKETEEIIPSDTPEDIWNLMQEHEKEDNK